MNLGNDITPDELSVFLQEADDQIQLLDEDVLRLEKEGQNPDILQEIFRAAHTLKGSSSMLGYKPMTELTHAIESLLDLVRNHRAEIDTEVVDSLLNGLDILKVLKQKLVADDGQMPDIKQVVKRIQNAARGDHDPVTVISQAAALVDTPSCDAISVRKRGDQLYRVSVRFDPKSKWLAVRCFQALSELNRLGKVIWSSPSSEEIQEEQTGNTFQAIFATTNRTYKVKESLASIGDVLDVTLTEQRPGEDMGPKDGILAKAGLTMPAIVQEPVALENESAESFAAPATEPIPLTTREARTETLSERSESLQSVRLDVRVLDNLMNMVEDLVIDRSRISQVSRMLESRYAGDELVISLGQVSNNLAKIIHNLRQGIIQVRMVPISVVFNKMPRLVRDLAKKENKLINLVVTGGDTELDNSFIEHIRNPIIHLLRNSVDHGIEIPIDRRAAGKSEKATVHLSAYQDNSQVFITVEDDGCGIDASRIRAAAVRKGLVSADAAARLSEYECMELIFMPGLSSVENVTEVSGRGVGLDIVRTNTEKLNGTVSIETRLGKGTKFIIQLPLTLAVFQGLLVSYGDAVYVIPLASVIETLLVGRDEVSSIMGHEVTRLRDKMIPLIRMNEVLGKTECAVRRTQHEYVVVIRAGERQAGIIVDRLMDQQEFVFKPLGTPGDLKGIAGASRLGDGRVALVVDVPMLARLASSKHSALRAAETVVA